MNSTRLSGFGRNRLRKKLTAKNAKNAKNKKYCNYQDRYLGSCLGGEEFRG